MSVLLRARTLDEDDIRRIVGEELADKWRIRAKERPAASKPAVKPVLKPTTNQPSRLYISPRRPPTSINQAPRRTVPGWPKLEYRDGGMIDTVR
jgi:hypothetical protein